MKSVCWSSVALTPRRRALLLWILIPAVFFLWFWLWRSGTWSGGDSEQWEREINQGIWWRRRQMLSFASMQLVFTAGRALAGWSARYAINVSSCAAGALAMLALWRLTRGSRWSGLAFAIAASAGFTTIFYGHIESYAQPVAALLLHLLAVRRAARRRWPPWTIAATFCLAMAFHLVILFTLPAAALILYLELRRRGSRGRDWRNAGLVLLPGVVLWAVVWSDRFITGELVGPHFIAPIPDFFRRPWIIFTSPMVPAKIWFMFWDGGAVSLAALWVFARVLWRPRRDPFVFYLAFYFICFLAFTAVWNPDAWIRDFDLFCFPWVIACLAVARQIKNLPWRPVTLGLILGVNAYLFITRTAVFADLPHRGYGTIYLERLVPTGHLLIRLDEEFRLFPVNRYVPAGGHALTIRGHRRHTLHRMIALRPGETVWLRLRPEGLDIATNAFHANAKQTGESHAHPLP